MNIIKAFWVVLSSPVDSKIKVEDENINYSFQNEQETKVVELNIIQRRGMALG